MTRELIDELISCVPEAFLTGTRVYGPARKASDWDVCVPWSKIIECRDFLSARIPNAKSEPSEYFQHSWLVFDSQQPDGSCINLIGLGQDDMHYWRTATRLMGQLPPYAIQHQRHAAFEMLRALAKMTGVVE